MNLNQTEPGSARTAPPPAPPPLSSMLCPASCLPLLREFAQWRCLLGWPRPHGVTSASAAGLTANTSQQQGSEVRGGAQGGGAPPPVGHIIPQQYSSSMCPLSVHQTPKSDRDEDVELRLSLCPCPGATCTWVGSLESIMPHLKDSHKSITTLQGEDIVFLVMDIDRPGSVVWLMMQSCFSHHFLLVVEKQQRFQDHQQFFAVVLLIGTRKQTETFAYRLELHRDRRRLSWEARPRPVHGGAAAAIMDSDCLVLDASTAHLFTHNGNLEINVTISMC
ncbi:E3 ubiquitin-protein ligase Siah2-like [Mugil cephalus]|uniref:E3 ubiquitin-protein ligase Siah2-like n=1 Tax=Mugil cephalus TaxID=48193 RepID=UPI001FB821B9|nr:E3 ubiquitin-protein ligase Siah2-like [Mugil cephalus]